MTTTISSWARHCQRLTAVTAFALGLVALPRHSIGADGKIINSTNCQLAGDAAGRLSYLVGGVMNISGINHDVMCGLLRDNTTNTNGISDLEMSVSDPTTGSFFCDAVSADRNGNLLKVVRRTSTKSGAQILDWGASLNLSASKGHYAITCTVPNNGVIHNVFVNEF
jgi:hypothetical protein